MSARATLATALRVLRQLRRDPWTVVPVLVVPSLLMGLLRWLYDGERLVLDRIGTPLLGVVGFVTMFLVASVVTLRERTGGTLERLLAMPLGKADLVGGQALALGLLAVAQAGVAGAVTLGALGLHRTGPAVAVVGVALLAGLLGTALGLLGTAFARTGFRVVPLASAVVLPQFLLCGLLVPRAEMGPVLRGVAGALPLTYAVDAVVRLRAPGGGTALRADLLAVAVATVVALALGAAALRRRTA